MKTLLVLVSLIFASPAFANCVSEMMACTQGDREEATRLCRESNSVCDLNQIIAENHGMNYSQAIELCARESKSNARVLECIAQGYNYSDCVH